MGLFPTVAIVSEHGNNANDLHCLPNTHLVHEQNRLPVKGEVQHLEDADKLVPTWLEGHEIRLVRKPRGLGLIPPIVQIIDVVVSVEVRQSSLCQAQELPQLLRSAGAEILDAAGPVALRQVIE